ncbi:hypothetical protein OCU04_010793 [Sclerotinia nivalis]|uniref:Uncharacterized protein n=1 Tax=Sclerotinia nivalis TaxID=352851 RepID=A0A9X0ACT3_9HELO|nr:hypothetical protein OCU04_010793 [Sclerotinia nivalis]
MDSPTNSHHQPGPLTARVGEASTAMRLAVVVAETETATAAPVEGSGRSWNSSYVRADTLRPIFVWWVWGSTAGPKSASSGRKSISVASETDGCEASSVGTSGGGTAMKPILAEVEHIKAHLAAVMGMLGVIRDGPAESGQQW